MLSKIQIQKTLDKTFVAISIKDDCHLIMCSDTMKHGRDNSYKGMIVIVAVEELSELQKVAIPIKGWLLYIIIFGYCPDDL